MIGHQLEAIVLSLFYNFFTQTIEFGQGGSGCLLGYRQSFRSVVAYWTQETRNHWQFAQMVFILSAGDRVQLFQQSPAGTSLVLVFHKDLSWALSSFKLSLTTQLQIQKKNHIRLIVDDTSLYNYDSLRSNDSSRDPKYKSKDNFKNGQHSGVKLNSKILNRLLSLVKQFRYTPSTCVHEQ